MELNVRKGPNVFLPPKSYRQLEARLQRHDAELAEMPVVVLACHDPQARKLPFMLFERFIFPAGARTVGGAVSQAGFRRTRSVFQLWNPHFRPSQARLDGRTPQLLLLSTMLVHVRRAYEAIRDAWTMGADRPLIVAGGPMAYTEPYWFWPVSRPQGAVGPDVVVSGEAYVLLDLLHLLMQFRGRHDTLRTAFERARHEGALNSVPGLIYLDPASSLGEPILVDTGLPRLLQHFDELPDEVNSLSVLEPPHRGAGLSPAPLADNRMRRHLAVLSIRITQGCKFSCSYCPISRLNQQTWRSRSPEGLARQMRSVRERFGIKFYFGTDDNFFNRRQTAQDILTALARTKIHGRRLYGRIKWGTEATQFDTYKNRDLLPLARQAGLAALWLGIEDLTASLVNKGQKPAETAELFSLLHAQKIMPMAMMMYHEGQPFRTAQSLYGLANQIDFLRGAGAISLQCTVHIPAEGTRDFEKPYEEGRMLAKLGSRPIAESQEDGNHILMVGTEAPWRRQLNLVRAYLTFYNPLNLFRALRDDGSPLRKERIVLQLIGFPAALWTAIQLLPHFLRLLFCKPTFHKKALPLSKVPVRLVPDAVPRFLGFPWVAQHADGKRTAKAA